LKHFRAAKESLGYLDAEAAATLIAAASDIALIVDGQGVIRDMAFHHEELAADLDGYARWQGRRWADVVMLDSRPKIETLLREAASSASPRWFHINLESARGTAVPILFTAVQAGDEGRLVAFGRDLRPMAALQQRIVDAQQSIEQDYSRLRHVEMRYRLLFQMSAEPVVIVDAATQTVVETNPSATRLFGGTAIVGQPFPDVFDAETSRAVVALLAVVQAAGRADDVRARLAGGEEFSVSASLFRQDGASLFLIRLASQRPDAAATAVPKMKWKLLKLVESAPDGFVITGPDGRILTVNAAFLDLAQLTSDEQAQGESLERWLGRPGVDLNVLIANLRQRGSVRLFATTLRGEYGATAEVEISAVAVMNSDKQCFGFTIRNVARRLTPEPRSAQQFPRSVEQLKELVGRVSLKDLVREATDVIERMSIEAALELTGDNRASAAEMLGMSRQSLYVKLRRYGLADSPEGGNGG
jgi:transcriptional regulator PpsR